MRSRVDVVLCLDDGQGACAFPRALAAHTGHWANWVSLLTGRYASAHGANAPGDPIRAWTNLPDLFRGAGYACRAYGVETLPFEWEHCPASAFPIQGNASELAVVAGRVTRSSAWVLHLKLPTAENLRVTAAVTPPEGVFAPARFDHPVSVVDLLPTLCRLLGLAIPPDVQGRSLLPLLEDKALAEKELAYAYAETADGSLIWNGERGVLIHPEGLFRLDAGLRRGAEETDEAMLAALGAAMLRAQDTLPIPQRRYRVKRHPDNLWFDASYRQTVDPGVIAREQPKVPHRRIPPVAWEG